MEIDFFEFEGSLVEDLFGMLDPKLQALQAGIDPRHPEEFGEFDTMEHICGVSAVTAQQFISTTCAWWKVDKKVALSLGPSVGKTTKIAAINAAANFWKHSDGGETPPHAGTKKTLEDAGIDFDLKKGDQITYLVSNIYYRCGYNTLAAITADLKDWTGLIVQRTPQT